MLFSCFKSCYTLQACVVSDNFASKKFCSFEAFQRKSVLSRITSFNLNCQTQMITCTRHLNVLLKLLEIFVLVFLSSIWTVNINVSCLEASILDFTALNLHHTLAHLSWLNFGACCFVQDLRSWRAEEKNWKEQGQQSRIVNMAPKIYKWSHG